MTWCGGALAVLGVLAVGCENMSPSRDEQKKTGTDRMVAKADAPVAVAEIHGAGDNKDKIHGTVTFTQMENGVKVVAEVDGLTPGKHGIHVHEGKDLSAPDLKGSGKHYNPAGESHKHSGPDDAQRHAGDLGNIEADDKGHGHLELTTDMLSVNGKNSVVDRSVIIHAKEDDLKNQPAGNSGDKIAGGVVKLKGSKAAAS
jgi:Cu-Zn family superoxide dismutase